MDKFLDIDALYLTRNRISLINFVDKNDKSSKIRNAWNYFFRNYFYVLLVFLTIIIIISLIFLFWTLILGNEKKDAINFIITLSISFASMTVSLLMYLIQRRNERQEQNAPFLALYKDINIQRIDSLVEMYKNVKKPQQEHLDFIKKLKKLIKDDNEYFKNNVEEIAKVAKKSKSRGYESNKKLEYFKDSIDEIISLSEKAFEKIK